MQRHATTFQAFLWRLLDEQAVCREAVQQVQLSHAVAHSGTRRLTLPSSSTSAFYQARERLEIPVIGKAAAAVAAAISFLSWFQKSGRGSP